MARPATTAIPARRGDSCRVPSSVPGCAADPAVESCVCGLDSYCCDVGWDDLCVDEVSTFGCGSCL